MFRHKMPVDSVQQLAVRVDKIAADFALQVEMFPAVLSFLHILVAGAFAVAQKVFAYLPLGQELFQVPVDGGLAYARSPFPGKVAGQLTRRHMAAPQGPHIVKNDLPLPGTVLRGPFLVGHRGRVLCQGRFVNMKMEIIFINLDNRYFLNNSARTPARARSARR
jgi:hypothetical protein